MGDTNIVINATYNQVMKLRPNVLVSDFILQDDGNGPFIKEWTSQEAELTQVEVDTVDDSPSLPQLALKEIIKLESQVTNRRLREAYADSTWLDAQEALIATERAKLAE